MSRQDQAEELDMQRFDDLQRRGFSYLEAHTKVFGSTLEEPKKCKYPFGGPRWPSEDNTNQLA